MKTLIADVPVSVEHQKIFEGFGLNVFFASQLTESLLSFPEWRQFNPETTLLVFPGNGSQILREFIPQSWLNTWNYTSVHAKRFWEPGQDPHVYTERIFTNRVIVGITDVVIVDDVISSGLTCRKIRAINRPWLANVRWHAATWIKQKNAGMKGFSSVFSALTVGTNTRRVPIISLSTLLSDTVIARSFAARNIDDSHAFLDALSSL
ncbi:phosphoribosyltransferase [Patescibacteria group bacterium]|nr:phosphoribosyltransferase [Patescibacteria group bacterium]